MPAPTWCMCSAGRWLKSWRRWALQPTARAAAVVPCLQSSASKTLQRSLHAAASTAAPHGAWRMQVDSCAIDLSHWQQWCWCAISSRLYADAADHANLIWSGSSAYVLSYILQWNDMGLYGLY